MSIYDNGVLQLWEVIPIRKRIPVRKSSYFYHQLFKGLKSRSRCPDFLLIADNS